MKIAFITDNIKKININTDSTYMMIKESHKRGWQTYIMQINDLFVKNNQSYGNASLLKLSDKPWYTINKQEVIILKKFNIIFMRKDPPVNINYITATYILSKAQNEGALIINNPDSLRNINEKISIIDYPEFAAKTIISNSFQNINDFLLKYGSAIVKPINNMGGEQIFYIKKEDCNKNVILETITKHQTKFIVIQEYRHEIKHGDKRILIINGEPLQYLVVRTPCYGDFRGNIKKGATTKINKITNKEYFIAKTIGKDLKNKGIIFAGIDIIGETLTEINITSPTMIQEIYKASGINAAYLLMESIENNILKKS